MGIVVACRCGQAFEADAWLAGKVVQCPVCRSPIAVPTPTAEVEPASIQPTHPTEFNAFSDFNKVELAPILRPRPTVSRESREAAESVGTFLVAGGVIFVVVLSLSTFIICYLKGTNPIVWVEKFWEQEERALETPAVQPQQTQPALAGPVPIAAAPIAVPVAPLPAPSGLPEGWSFYEHPAARFSALLPASPEIIERKVENVGGDNTFFILAVSQDEHVYEATREFRTFRIGQGEEAAAYDALISKRVDEMKGGKIEGTANVMIEGRLVCDARLRGSEEGKEVRKYLRLIASGDSVFELSCRVPPGKERPAEIKAFLGNYRLQ